MNGLQESTYKIIFVKYGGATPVQNSSSFSSCEKNPFYLHAAESIYMWGHMFKS